MLSCLTGWIDDIFVAVIFFVPQFVSQPRSGRGFDGLGRRVRCSGVDDDWIDGLIKNVSHGKPDGGASDVCIDDGVTCHWHAFLMHGDGITPAFRVVEYFDLEFILGGRCIGDGPRNHHLFAIGLNVNVFDLG